MLNRRSTVFAQSQRGFTLSEILVTTAIFAIIMIAALAVYDQSNKVFKGSTEAADMQQSTRVGFDKLVSDIRMAGFDYNRGGTPTNSWEAPQPDEQIEYAGPTAIAFRANFNYNVNAANGNGLEPSITPHNTTGQNIFPYVSTNNSEIVIYALRSADASKNTDSIAFYVDDYSPRQVFPNGLSPASGTTSKTEDLVTLGSAACATCGIDLSNANPPYTLYRITVADVLAHSMGTPVAENIRSLNFKYYQDAQGQTLLKNSAGGTDITLGYNGGSATGFTATGTGAIGGAGQYDPNSIGTTTRYTDRDTRSFIQSIKVDLVGMNASPDLQGYQNPAETATAFQKYRQYALSSLVVPRNLGKTGFPEPVYAPPGPPTITGMCTGFCGAPVIYWVAPTAGGPVESYQISWDTSATGTFASPHTLNADPSATSAILPDDTVSDPSATWYYRIAAVNSNGSSPYSALYTAIPINNTKPLMKTDVHGTDPSTSDAQANQITVSFTSPTDNAGSLNTLSCTGTGGSTDGSKIPSAEPLKYKILRSTVQNFTAAQATTVLDFTSASQPAGGVPGSAITWIDKPANDPTTPPANCVQYYYRVIAANRCRSNNSYNTSNSANDAMSDPYPAWGSNAVKGQANGTGTPAAPAALTVDTANSGCPLGAGTNCTIKLQWNKVTSDTGGAAIGIDTYRIFRYSKHAIGIPASGYTLDTTFGTAGHLDVSGFSSIAGAVATWTDTTAPVSDTAPWAGLAFSYEYKVAAVGLCGATVVGGMSPAADYPIACTVNPTIVQAGAAAGSGSGDTPADPWIFNLGDTITVTPPVGVTLTSVVFDISVSAGAPVASTTDSSSPFLYSWPGFTSGVLYQVTITVTTSTGCSEVHIKYVSEQVVAPCAFTNITAPAPSAGTSGSTRNETFNFSVPIAGGDTITLVGQPFSITWTDPRTPSSGTWNVSFDNITYPVSKSTNGTGGSTSATPSVPAALVTTTGSAPGGTSTVASGSNMILSILLTHKKTEDDFSTAATSALRKVCIGYTIPSEPGVVKKCNLVGQAASTANPASCD
jgi:prepilin-type N-terminal cleavage/methylation domain-containing protein